MAAQQQLVLAVPVFNAERFLPATLKSLNEQGDSLRWWLQDGASTDGTLRLAREFARPGDTIVSEKDSGQTDALNRAVSRMGGDIIGFLNGDDVLKPHTAEKVLHYFAEHPEIDLVYGAVEFINQQGEIVGHHTGRISTLTEVLDIYKVWWQKRQWVQPEVFFRRSLWEKVGGFDVTYNLAFDFDFWVRCFLAGARVGHLPITLCQFRFHPGQKSTAKQRAADEIRAITTRHLPNAPISFFQRWQIEAHLSYDLYQLGKNPRAQGSFAWEMLKHPRWWLSSYIRSRAGAACARRVFGGK